MIDKYDDIINLDRPISKKHKPMSLYNRAAQFAPFAALTGYDDVIYESGRSTDKKKIMDEYEASDINNRLLYLIDNKDITASFTYFVKDKYKDGGSYNTVIGSIKKINYESHDIVLNDKTTIKIDSIYSIEY